nr:protein hgh1 like [Quercus suber]
MRRGSSTEPGDGPVSPIPAPTSTSENLVPYSTSQPSLFKYNECEPIKDLKLLLKDYEPIAKNALNIMINLSGEDDDVRKRFATDETFMESLMRRITVRQPDQRIQQDVDPFRCCYVRPDL